MTTQTRTKAGTEAAIETGTRIYTPEELGFAAYLNGFMSQRTCGLHYQVSQCVLAGKNLQELAKSCYDARNPETQDSRPDGYGISTRQYELPIENSLDAYLNHVQGIVEANCNSHNLPAPPRSCLWRS